MGGPVVSQIRRLLRRRSPRAWGARQHVVVQGSDSRGEWFIRDLHIYGMLASDPGALWDIDIRQLPLCGRFKLPPCTCVHHGDFQRGR